MFHVKHATASSEAPSPASLARRPSSAHGDGIGDEQPDRGARQRGGDQTDHGDESDAPAGHALHVITVAAPGALNFTGGVHTPNILAGNGAFGVGAGATLTLANSASTATGTLTNAGTLNLSNTQYDGAVVNQNTLNVNVAGAQTTSQIGGGLTIASAANPGTTIGAGATLTTGGSAIQLQSGTVTIANGATLAGHVEVGSFVTLGGLSAVHQFTRLGDSSFLAGGTIVVMDVPPYCMAQGDRAELSGINEVGLKRRGFTDEQVARVKDAYRALFRQKQLLKDAVAQLRRHRHDDAHAAIGQSHHDRRGHGPDQPVVGADRGAALAGERVGRPFEGEGRDDGGELGEQQQHRGAEHAQLQVAPVRRPDIGPEVDDGGHQRAAVGGHAGWLVGRCVSCGHSEPGSGWSTFI